MSTISSNGPPLRWRTVRQSSSGSSTKASSGSAVTTIQAGSPARVAGEEAHPADRELVWLCVGRHEPDPVEDRRGRGVDVVELGEHHECLGLHRAADEHRVAGAGQAGQRRHRSGRGHVGRAAQDEPHRAVLVVMRDEDDRLPKVRIVQRRRGDQQLTPETVQLTN
jgi:hypothetical protein